MNHPVVFGQCKPLRNRVRNLCLADSLMVIHAYIAHLQFDTPINRAIEVPERFLFAENKVDKVSVFSEWELETLCREVIVHSKLTPPCQVSLRQGAVMSKVVTELKRLEEFIADKFVTPETVLLELHRMAHRQFPWQMSSPSAANFMRYYLVYRHSILDNLVKKVTGLSIDEVFFIGMALLGVFMREALMPYPPSVHISGLTVDQVDRFLRHFSAPLGSLKEHLVKEREANDRFAYSYHSLRAFPIIQMHHLGKNSLLCPLPTLLFWRFTSGVYYEICKEAGFDNAFGEAFGRYVGSVLKKAFDLTKYEVIAEESYRDGKDLKSTVDWVVSEGDAALFIEAKTKRLVVGAKSEILSSQALSAELAKMARSIVQVYKAIVDYQKGLYPSNRYRKGWKIYPVVVTLEDWFLMGSKVLGELNGLVLCELEMANLPADMLSDSPYTLCSSYELEQAAQVMNHVGVAKVMGGKVSDPGKREHALDAYIRSDFKSELPLLRCLYSAEYHEFLARHGLAPEQ